MIGDFKSKYNIDKLYRLKSLTGSSRIEFGWIDSDTLDLSVPIVISYSSDEKAVERSAATFDDYHQYFLWFTSFEPAEYFDIMRSKDHLKETVSFTDEQIDFIWALGTFLIDKKSFSLRGRSYKLVEYEHERSDQATEISPKES